MRDPKLAHILVTINVVPHFVTEVLHGRVRTNFDTCNHYLGHHCILKSTMSRVEVDVDTVMLEGVDVIVLEEGVAS